MGRDGVAIRQATQYVDHNILQTGYENADDHRFLRSVCQRYGALFSGPGNGISHWAHMERFDMPGETMLGCDSHTPHAGACGMLAIGAGGFEVASAMAGEPYRLTMPEVVNVKLTGTFKRWVSAKDVILELLHRFDVKWAKNKVLEYTGPGLKELTVPSRGTIANMGTELGATASVFPTDGMTKQFLTAQARGKDFKPLAADDDAPYDDTVEVDLGKLEPLIACPSSPDNVKPVREVAGTDVAQVAVGSSVNSSFRDLSIVAHALDGKHVASGISMAVSPGSRQTLLLMLTSGLMTKLIKAGVRELEVACGPCIGMGFAPPTRGPSVRTFNRNFEGRSGTPDDLVYLCSPETAADGDRRQDRRSAGPRKTADVGRAREIPGRHERVRAAAEGSGLGQGHPRPEHRPAARRESSEGCDRRRGPDPTRGQHLDGPHHAGGRQDPPAAVEHPRDRRARLRIRRFDVPGEGEEGRGRIHRRGGQLWTRVLARTRGRRPDVPRCPSRPREELRPHPSGKSRELRNPSRDVRQSEGVRCDSARRPTEGHEHARRDPRARRRDGGNPRDPGRPARESPAVPAGGPPRRRRDPIRAAPSASMKCRGFKPGRRYHSHRRTPRWS